MLRKWLRRNSSSTSAETPPASPHAPEALADALPLATEAALTEALLACGFQPERYRDAHPDLILHASAPEQALTHFLTFGVVEGRHVPIELAVPRLAELAKLRLEDQAYKHRLVALLARSHFGDVMERDVLAEHWNDLTLLRTVGARPYFVIGDSHAANYVRSGATSASWLLPIQLNCTAGSAIGLGNAASRSGYGRKIERFVRTVFERDQANALPIIWTFGQVDAEFVYTFKRIESKLVQFDRGHYEAFCRRSVERYVDFLARVVPAPRRAQSFIASIFPPALSDEAWTQGYVNAHVTALESNTSPEDMANAVRALEIPTRHERTALHRYYNDRLFDAVAPLGFQRLDLFDALLGADGSIGQPFIQYGEGRDHHLDFAGTEPVIEAAIRRMTASS